jgi:hypothetical protein
LTDSRSTFFFSESQVRTIHRMESLWVV